MRVIFWGMRVSFSAQVLEHLLEDGLHIAAVMVPAGPEQAGSAAISRLSPDAGYSSLPIANPYMQQDIVSRAWQLSLPVYAVGTLSSPDTLAVLGEIGANVGLVACFPKRLPPELLALPAHGFLNLHPSLLPALRGPQPIFWTFRLGLRRSGVTVHYLDTNLDMGDIALQEAIQLPTGISSQDVEMLLARRGGRLLAQATHLLADGRLPRHPQPAGGSYYGEPNAADFVISPRWAASVAFNFIRGTGNWGRPYPVRGPGVNLVVRSAVAVDADGRLGVPWQQVGSDCWIQFSPGVLHARF